MSDITPSQTVGPFFAYGLAPHNRCDWKPNANYDWKETIGANLITPDATGTKVRIEGCITDGDGKPITIDGALRRISLTNRTTLLSRSWRPYSAR